LLFLIYPFVSLTILQTFSCETFDKGESALKILPFSNFWCDTIFATNHHRLDEAIEHDTRIRLLARGYRPDQYHFELVEIVRKLLQTSTMVFILPGGIIQIFSQSLITIVAISLLIYSKPYKLAQRLLSSSICTFLFIDD